MMEAIEHSKHVGDYQVTSKLLGKGQFGKVFLGYDKQQLPVAIKVIDRMQLNSRQIAYLNQEITALKNLNNDYIIRFYDVLKTTNKFYLVIEYCEGGDLKKYIEERKGLPEEEALHYFYQIIRGFQSIVKANLIHRDLKPANIMLKNGQIKIGDFGLAKTLT